MGVVTHWNCPLPGTAKGVYWHAFDCRIICQNPAVRLTMVKSVLPNCLIL